ncbi:hypothetical protein [Lactobacillus xylocopicola]|uniref:hypothetical protein n=1 Tax=Lactobacillus xylocopicola TaxID=2976676 RepID=UPI0029545695|nr:hypothetical protein [Lactobacillus xylocopicola]
MCTSSKVVTGNLNNHFEKLNFQLNFATGCRVLLIAIAALLVLNLLWPKAAEGLARLHNK